MAMMWERMDHKVFCKYTRKEELHECSGYCMKELEKFAQWRRLDAMEKIK